MTNKILQSANEFLEENIKFEKKTSLNFLYGVTALIISNENSNEILNKYLRQIKKAIKTISKTVDEDYLLIKNELNDSFMACDNYMFLRFSESLIEKLNEVEEISLAEKLNMIKSKIDLGFERYFKKNKIEMFSPKYKTILNNFSKETITTEIIRNVKDIKKYEKILLNFPLYIYTKKTKKILEIEKSTFIHEELDMIEFKKENIITRTHNVADVAAYLIYIIKDGR